MMMGIKRSGDDGHKTVRAGIAVANFIHQLNAVHGRHFPVDNQKVGGIIADDFPGGFAVYGIRNARATEYAKDMTQQGTDEIPIVNDQHTDIT